ncbi:TPA: helix-turn-helix transcriptional regulator [Aeromonas hydrophila]|uniref:helix-turn-helix transcriptional regulator n=1 Tax=Aeromonas caviae TaxID=648 RepID=UPI00301569BD
MDDVHMLTRSELAMRWRVSKSTIDKQMIIAPEKLPPFVTIGRQTRFPLNEVEKWERKQLQNLN